MSFWSSRVQSLTQALYHLAANSECIKPLREEIERVVSQEGWTKLAMGELLKLDSFLKESQRLSGLGPQTVHVFTRIPAGITITIAALPTHMDDGIYPNAKEVDAFRFVNMKGDNS
ncbi:hypothetical protein D9615_003288 [Tricholomella constricta]|uniref:Uncharacterized protein n=1 Tax=Tricholomella constricta TaxID=117010 RepID=A0A8H5HJ49_9AGAR|nr:hypothetical protein D9615_003288 [Tricholomella constricta]